MVRPASAALTLGLLFGVSPALAAEYYVAPGGSGTTCSMAAPCGRVEDAQTRATGGDTVWIRGGMYTFAASVTVGVNFNKAGTSGNPIRYFAYLDEIPIFDLSNGTPNGRVTGLNIQTSFIHVRGLQVRGVQQYMSGQDSWGVRIQGSNNVVERVDSHHNEAPGFFITSGANNLILNCDSHHNYDQLENGGSGDGFGCHSTGAGNVMRGCRAWANSDDGYDFINAPGVCTVEKSFAINNGYVPDTTTAAGNGAGFKAGGFGSPPSNVPNPVPRHVVRQCVAFGNRAQGFYANHHPGGLDFFNNIAFRNGTNYNMLTDTTSDHKLRNNIAMTPGTAISQLTGGTDTFNSWTLQVTVSSADFTSVMESEALAARQADGSLPNMSFLRLAMGSDLIDKGENVGLPFAGSAPDLGPFELGLTAGTGGMGGAGGTGTGGRGGGAGTASGGGPGGTTGTGGAAGSGTGGTAGTSAGGTTGGAAGLGSGGTAPSAGTGAGGAAIGGSATGGTGGTGGTATGGVPGTGGATTGGASSGGANTGGTSTSGGGGSSGDDGGGDDASGCGCRTGETRGRSAFGSLALAALALAFARRRNARARV
ncbi:MAG TPA: right-handed parallel beta-helix repeat-containing protein [Polyangiaceae bacterium]